MARKDIKLELEIVDLKRDIEKLVLETGEDKMSKEVQELRHFLFHVHSLIEIELEFQILWGLFLPTKGDADAFSKFIQLSKDIVSFLAFPKKIDKTQTILDPDKISKEVWGSFRELNSLRVLFAHPKGEKYTIFDNRIKYKEALEKILQSLDSLKKMNKIAGDKYSDVVLSSTQETVPVKSKK